MNPLVLLFWYLGLTGPAGLVVATTRGETLIPIRVEHGHPAVPAPFLARVLPLTSEIRAEWAQVSFAGQPFRFLLDAPVFLHGNRVVTLAGGAYVDRDTLFLPLQWLSGYIPQVLSEGYRYDPLAGRFEETSVSPVVTKIPVVVPRPVAAAPRKVPTAASRLAPAGVLRSPHLVVVDAGHGGEDPGNPGLHFPGNLREKDINLAIAKALRTELRRRGIDVIMTRTRDSLITLSDRGKVCRDECDLFVSIHVNSLPRRPGFESVSGFETYFRAESRSAEAQRVENMENEAMRYETSVDAGGGGALDFIKKDLQTNEHLRESALLADLIQTKAGRVHPGGSHGVSQAGFVVLNTARRPAVLIETGFSTNRTDGRFLSAPAGQQRLASAIADGIVAYFQRYENKVATESEP
ncbi:MAG: N-acetylmuramoyl-L-alanine amidase [Gemmatimonadetes bacterium]|nr:N-acetylmuramoyl-L-alanine amidase [Gemmatimonadota bacterium]